MDRLGSFTQDDDDMVFGDGDESEAPVDNATTTTTTTPYVPPTQAWVSSKGFRGLGVYVLLSPTPKIRTPS